MYSWIKMSICDIDIFCNHFFPVLNKNSTDLLSKIATLIHHFPSAARFVKLFPQRMCKTQMLMLANIVK